MTTCGVLQCRYRQPEPAQPLPGAVFALVIAILVSVVAWRVYRGLQSSLPARAANEDGERPAPARQAP